MNHNIIKRKENDVFGCECIKKFKMKTEIITTHSFYIDNDILWMIHSKYNAIIKYNLLSKELQYFDGIFSEFDNNMEEYGYCRIVKKGNKIILIPNQSRSIMFINEKTHEYHSIEIGNHKLEYGLFRSALFVGKKLVLIPSQFGYISSLSIEQEIFSQEMNWKQLSQLYNDDSYISDFSVENDLIALLIKPYNDVIIYSVKDNTAEKIRIGHKFDNIISIAMLNNKIFVYDKTMGICEINRIDNNFTLKNHLYLEDLYLYKFGDDIMVDFLRDNKIAVLDDLLEAKKEYYENKENIDEYVYLVYHDDMRYNDLKVYYNNATGELLFFDKMNIEKRERLDCTAIRDELIAGYLEKHSFISESSYINIEDFARHISNYN